MLFNLCGLHYSPFTGSSVYLADKIPQKKGGAKMEGSRCVPVKGALPNSPFFFFSNPLPQNFRTFFNVLASLISPHERRSALFTSVTHSKNASFLRAEGGGGRGGWETLTEERKVKINAIRQYRATWSLDTRYLKKIFHQ